MSGDIVDIVQRLRLQAIVEAKKFGDAADLQIEWKAATEIAHLRSRVEVLERVRAAAQALINEDAGDDPAEDAWWEWEKNCEVLRVALKEAKP